MRENGVIFTTGKEAAMKIIVGCFFSTLRNPKNLQRVLRGDEEREREMEGEMGRGRRRENEREVDEERRTDEKNRKASIPFQIIGIQTSRHPHSTPTLSASLGRIWHL